MANLIDKSYFTGIIQIATGRTDVVVQLDSTIATIESELLPLVSYDENVPAELSDIKNMLAYFTYFTFVQDEASFNTTVGNVSGNVENSTKILDTRKLIRAYNKGVEIYNEYTIDEQKRYLDSFMI